MQPKGSEEYYRNRSRPSSYDSRRGDRLLDLYTQQSEEQQRGLEQQGKTRADQIYNSYKSIGDTADNVVSGYQEGKRFAREGKKYDQDMALSEEQLAKAKMDRAQFGKENEMLYGPGWDKPKVAPAYEQNANFQGPSATMAGPLSMRERQLSQDYEKGQADIAASADALKSGEASRQFMAAQSANLGREERRAREEKAATEVESALVQAAMLPDGDPNKERLQSYAQTKAAEARIDAGGLALRTSQAPGKAAMAQGQAASAKRIVALADPIFQKIDPQIGQLEEKGNELESRITALNEFEKASPLGGGEDVPLAKLTAGMDPVQADRIKKSLFETGKFQKTRAREELVSDLTQMEQQLASLKSRAVNASPDAKEVLNSSIQAIESQLGIAHARLNGPRIGQVIDGDRYIGGPPDQPTSWERAGPNGGPMLNANFGG